MYFRLKVIIPNLILFVYCFSASLLAIRALCPDPSAAIFLKVNPKPYPKPTK